MTKMSILNRIILLVAAHLAGYMIVTGIEGYNNWAVFYFTVAFGVLVLACLLMMLFGCCCRIHRYFNYQNLSIRENCYHRTRRCSWSVRDSNHDHAGRSVLNRQNCPPLYLRWNWRRPHWNGWSGVGIFKNWRGEVALLQISGLSLASRLIVNRHCIFCLGPG